MMAQIAALAALVLAAGALEAGAMAGERPAVAPRPAARPAVSPRPARPAPARPAQKAVEPAPGPHEEGLALERDPAGRLVRRGQVVLFNPDEGALAAGRALGLVEIGRSRLDAAGVGLVILRAPKGATAADLAAALKAAAPEAEIDLNPVYTFQDEDSGEVAQAAPAPASAAGAAPAACPLGLVDGALAPDERLGVRVRARRFVDGPPAGEAHARAVAALLAQGAPGAALLAADVASAGEEPVADAASIARAIDWVAGEGACVVNLSLAGPESALLARVVAAIARRGVVLVAAAGNGGPGAPPAHPAALPEVVAVTAVDRAGRIWRRANQGAYVDFAALGVKVAVPHEGAKARARSGTSYAAPIVAGLLLQRINGAPPAPERAAAAVAALAQGAVDLGAPGRDPVFGHGWVIAER